MFRSRKKVEKLYEINIEAMFGSEFQKESFNASLEIMLRGLLEFYRTTHKDNKFGVIVIEAGKKKEL